MDPGALPGSSTIRDFSLNEESFLFGFKVEIFGQIPEAINR